MDDVVSTRAVKLKVLYTFDSEHKNNHLARWPHSIEVQSAQVDENTLIGITNLRTCLEAVTTASPELVSNIDNDFTVYAYDYSEPDTPLVGQGMLSKAMSQEMGSESENEAMVTGRISKNVMGLFSKNALETLEVKLRLTAVASPSYQRRRSGSVCSTSENVQQQWNSLSHSNGVFRPSSPMDTSGLEAMQRMLSEGGAPRERTGSYQLDSYHNPSSRPVSRSGTPGQVQNFNVPARQSGSQSRPGSRAGVRQTTHARRDSFNSGYFSGEETIEDGPARKRARIQKVDCPSKSNLNIERQPDSLRVAASTASSVRLHRPVAQYPGIAALQNGNTFEEPARPPTPIPKQKPTRPRGRPRKVIHANLLRGPPQRRSSPAHQDSAEPSLSSPEDVRADSVTSTPAELPSSPPVMPEQQNYVTSPALPPFTNNDSGFMSGNLDDLFDDQLLDFGDFIHDKTDGLDQDGNPLEFHIDATITADLPAVFEETEQTNAEMPPPAEKPEPAPAPRPFARAQSYTAGNRPIVPAPRLAPALAPRNSHSFETNHTGNGFPEIPASDPVGRSFHRSNTWAPDMSDSIMSDIGPGGEDRSDARTKKRVGKEQTRARLENAIASGQMPPFCDNCGAIETPAWRRAFTKVFDTPYEEFQTSLEQGECCYKEPVEHNRDGTVKLWKGYRAEKRPDEKSAELSGWTQICLCNPCGLWFHKSKCPRPPEKWQKRDPNDKGKRKRGSRAKARPDPPRLATRNDAPTPASDDSSPADDGGDSEEYGDNNTGNDEANDDNEPQLPPVPPRHRSGSAEPVRHGVYKHKLRPALRQVQSSPPQGNQRTVPIEIDLTPKPLRRQLFPSPDNLNKKAHVMVNMAFSGSDTQLPTFVRRSPRLNKVRDVLAESPHVPALVSVGSEGKENVAPTYSHGDMLEELFDGAHEDFMMPPSTPTPKRRSERILFKTPGRTPSREFGKAMSPNMQPGSPSIKTPKNKTHPATAILISTAQRNLNPSEMTPFTRSIHDALNNSHPNEYLQTPEAGSSGRSRRSLRKDTPRGSNNDIFDFPDLPSLHGSSPMVADPNFTVNFSELTTDHVNADYHDVFSTDAPMPSSPPTGYFDFVNVNDAELHGIWGEMVQDEEHSTYPPLSDGRSSAQEKGEGRRRSPRKKHAS